MRHMPPPNGRKGILKQHTISRAQRSREPSTSVRVVRRGDEADALRAAALAATDRALRPPSASSTAAHSEVSAVPVRRVVGAWGAGNLEEVARSAECINQSQKRLSFVSGHLG